MLADPFFPSPCQDLLTDPYSSYSSELLSCYLPPPILPFDYSCLFLPIAHRPASHEAVLELFAEPLVL